MPSLTRVAVLLLFSARLHAVAVVGPETAAAPQPSGPSASLTTSPAAAASPEGFFVAWFDSSDPLGEPRLVGTRLSRAGELLDPFGITLEAPATATSLEVSWSGTEYVVASGGRAWMVAPDGTVRGPLAPVPGPRARNARGEVVAVESTGSTQLWFLENGVHTNPVTLSGSVLDVHVVMPVEDDWIVLASQEDGTVRWFRANRQGLISTNIVETNTTQQSIAASPSEIVISWVTSRPTDSNVDLVVFGYTVIDARSGAYRDEIIELTLVPFGGSPYTTTPFVTFDGQRFVFVSTRFANGEHQIRMLSEGTVRTVATSDLRHPITDVTVASGAGNLLLWQVTQARANRSGSSILARVYERVENLDGPLPAVLVTRAPATQVQPRAAAGANGVFTAWREVSDTGRIAGRFHPSAGAPATSRFDVSTKVGDADALAVAANADTYLVAWREIDLLPLAGGGFASLRVRIGVRRYDANGLALDTAPIIIADTTAPGSGLRDTGVSAIADGSSFIVAWVGELGRLHAARIAARGTVFASVRPTTETPQAGPRLVRTGGRVVALWNTTSLQAAPLNENVVLGTPMTLLEHGEILFDAAATDSELLVAWSGAATCFGSRRYNAALIPIEPEHAILCDGQTYLPAVAWDGRQWWITAASTLGNQPLLGWELDATGATEPPLTIVAREQRPIDVAIVRMPTGDLLTLYSRLDESSAYTWHIFMRPLLQQIRGRAVRH